MYFFNAKAANTAPIMHTPIHESTVALQPKDSDTIAIPYIEIDAPMYVQALQSPPTVDALPVFAKRPGTQEISKKLQECINAQTIQASSKHKILQDELFTLIKKHIGIQSATDIPKSITEPLTSLLKTLPLCIARTANRLIIEKIGKTTEAKIELSLDCSNTSL